MANGRTRDGAAPPAPRSPRRSHLSSYESQVQRRSVHCRIYSALHTYWTCAKPLSGGQRGQLCCGTGCWCVV